MELCLQIPDDIAERLAQGPAEMSQRALEAWAAGEYRNGRLNKPDLRRLLGFESGIQIDDFLHSHGIFEEYTFEDVSRDVAALQRLGY